MDCRTFTEMLPRYLSGDLPAERFEAMVEHEAQCTSCQELAAAAMSGTSSEWAAAKSAPERVLESTAEESAWLEQTLARTVGVDCNYVRLRLAETVDRRLAGDTTRRVEQHLARCAGCRALGEVLRELPAYYDALPRLRADERFAPEIVARTLPRRLRWVDVVRSLLHRPETLWEGAVVCAILAAPLAGPSVSAWIQHARQTQASVEQRVNLPGWLTSLENDLAATGDRIRVSIAGRGREVVDGWSRTRARVEQSIHNEIAERAASDPRFAVVAPLIRDALGRIGLLDDDPSVPQEDPPSEEPGAQPETDASSGQQARPVAPDPQEPQAPAERGGSPGQNEREANPHVLR